MPVRRGSAPGTELERRRQGASREQGRGAERQGGRGEAPLGGEQARAGGMRSSCRRGEGGGVRRLVPRAVAVAGAAGEGREEGHAEAARHRPFRPAVAGAPRKGGREREREGPRWEREWGGRG